MSDRGYLAGLDLDGLRDEARDLQRRTLEAEALLYALDDEWDDLLAECRRRGAEAAALLAEYGVPAAPGGGER